MKFSTRDLVYIAIFGALWGLLEITIGSYLHVLFPPLADTFLVGVIMGSLGILTSLVGRRFVPKAGAVLMMAVIAMLLKALSLGGVTLGPMLAILMEGLLMELGLLAWRGQSPWSFALAGALAVSWNFFHKFVMMRLLYGTAIVEVALKMAKDGAKMLGMDPSAVALILGVLFVVRFIVGALAGWAAWGIGLAVAGRRAQRFETGDMAH
jgi:ABC-type thiamin/hydroxymethylpyrimidine transport system permease subunit